MSLSLLYFYHSTQSMQLTENAIRVRHTHTHQIIVLYGIVGCKILGVDSELSNEVVYKVGRVESCDVTISSDCASHHTGSKLLCKSQFCLA